jgi:glycosyltransferase involved in cell wall biosynthesis
MRDNDEIYEKLIQFIGDDIDKIEVIEYQPDIKKIYQQADVVLLTSASESFSNVLAEAKVVSRPVVMYDIPWLRLSGDGTGVWKVKQRDMDAAALAVVELLCDETLWSRYSEAAWNSIQSDMNRDFVQEWVDVFNTLPHNMMKEKEGYVNAINILLDQFYGEGYPYIKDDEESNY